MNPVGLEPTTYALAYHFGFHRLLRVRGLDCLFIFDITRSDVWHTVSALQLQLTVGIHAVHEKRSLNSQNPMYDFSYMAPLSKSVALNPIELRVQDFKQHSAVGEGFEPPDPLSKTFRFQDGRIMTTLPSH